MILLCGTSWTTFVSENTLKTERLRMKMFIFRFFITERQRSTTVQKGKKYFSLSKYKVCILEFSLCLLYWNFLEILSGLFLQLVMSQNHLECDFTYYFPKACTCTVFPLALNHVLPERYSAAQKAEQVALSSQGRDHHS